LQLNEDTNWKKPREIRKRDSITKSTNESRSVELSTG